MSAELSERSLDYDIVLTTDRKCGWCQSMYTIARSLGRRHCKFHPGFVMDEYSVGGGKKYTGLLSCCGVRVHNDIVPHALNGCERCDHGDGNIGDMQLPIKIPMSNYGGSNFQESSVTPRSPLKIYPIVGIMEITPIYISVCRWTPNIDVKNFLEKEQAKQ